HPPAMDENRGPGLFVAADVHYLDRGGARAAAVVAADAAFTHVLAEYTALTPEVPPVFVTAAGVSRTDAGLVPHMAGRFRIPDALRRADTLARTGPSGVTQTSRHPANQRAHRCLRARILKKSDQLRNPGGTYRTISWPERDARHDFIGFPLRRWA